MRLTFACDRARESGLTGGCRDNSHLRTELTFYRALLERATGMGRVSCERNAAGSAGSPGKRLEQGGDCARPDLGGRTSPQIRSGRVLGQRSMTLSRPRRSCSICACWTGDSPKRSRRGFGYYLSHFVKPDGTFDYYGPAISEYGQMLALAARYVRVTGDTGWLRENLPALQRIAEFAAGANGRQPQALSARLALLRPALGSPPKPIRARTRGSIFRATCGAGAGWRKWGSC